MPGLCLGSAVLSSAVRNFLAPSRPQCQAIPTPWPHSWQSHGTPSPAAGGRALCWKGEGHGRFLHHRQLSAPCLSIPTPPVLQDTITAERRAGRGTDIPDWEPWWWWLLMARPGRADSAAGLLLIPLPTSPITSPQLRLHPPIQPGLPKPRRCPNHGSSTEHTGTGTAPVAPDGRDSGQPGPAPPRSPAAGEAPVHLPGPGERTKEGSCSGGSGAAGCAAARIIRPGTAPGAPAAPGAGSGRSARGVRAVRRWGGGSSRLPTQPHPGSSCRGPRSIPPRGRGRAHPG